MQTKTKLQIRTERRTTPTVRVPIVVACLWPKTGENLGTLARTVDAVGATMVVPDTANATSALRRGDTIGLHNILWSTIADPETYLRTVDARIVAVELAWDAEPLSNLVAAHFDTVLLLGHEATGIPQWALDLADETVEIPMTGVGSSLNVAVAGSLVLYKLAGLT